MSAAGADARIDALAHALAGRIEGEVRFDGGTRALYATDASNYRQVPYGVVVPRSLDDVLETVRLCREHEMPIGLRGGGTSLAGQACNTAVIIDFSKYLDRVRSIDPERRIAEVEPGCVLDSLRRRAEEHGLTFGPDPATHSHNTLGGMIGNNSCGVHSVAAGRTSDNVESLDILTYDGVRMPVGATSDEAFARIVGEGGRRAEIYRALDDFRTRHAALIRAQYPRIPRRVSGYENLDELLPENGFNVARALVGTEASCVTVLGAVLRLVPHPPVRALAILGFPDVYTAADAVPEALEHGPIGLEGVDELLIAYMRKKGLHAEDAELLPQGSGWLLAEFGGDSEDEAAGKAERLGEAFRGRGAAVSVLRKAGQQSRIWDVRESGLAATAHIPDQPETYPGWEDTAVPREALGDYLRELRALFRRYGYEASVYGHFGDGLIHCRIPFDLRTEEGVGAWQHFLDEAADLVVRFGGSFSGEHGDGQARAALLEKMYGRELVQAFREFKAIWDPDGRMNPGKAIDPYPITANLRVGPDYQPKPVETQFAYMLDGGSFAKATRRCVGVGKCRRTDPDGGVMCPSFVATREEKHSTRGRARLLFEMLHGGAICDGWSSEAVEESLNLCLACKGCRSDCPVQVDMATYKAEFRAHHYKGRLRPRAAYSMGLIHRWSRLAGHVPRLANAMTHAPGLAAAAKWIGGIAPQRAMPRYAPQPFTEWFRNRATISRAGPRVLLWPDTFNNYFNPATAIAATRVLESLGYRVQIPRGPVCCGRALYDWGMIDTAKALWHRTFATLIDEIRAGTPVIGLEPACTAAFKDELVGLMPSDERATRLSAATVYFADFVARHDGPLPTSDRAAIVHAHCHHHAVLGFEGENDLLGRIGVAADVLPSGCCGMAGAFGFETEKYDLSMRLAERVLLPRVREAAADTAVIADGFSCREQIEQGCGRPTMHVAELMAEGLPRAT